MRVTTVLWLLSAAFIVYGGALPFRFTADRIAITSKLRHLPISPFISPETGRRVSIPDVAQNVVLFMPFGAFGVVVFRQRRSLFIATLAITAVAAALSGATEAVQLFEVERTTSVSDVCANIIGTVAGVVAAIVASRSTSLPRLRSRALGVVDVPAFYPFMVATIVLCIAAWEPFDFTLDVGALVGRLRALRADLWQFSVVGDEGIELIRYACFGLAASEWLRQIGSRRNLAIAAGGGTCLALALEASQWIIDSRMPGLKDGLVHAGGVLLGVAIARDWPHGRSPAQWTGWLWVATGAAGAAQVLSPSMSTPPITVLPSASSYERATFETLRHSFEMLLLYFPFGFAAAASARPRTALLIALVGTVAIAVPLDYLQGGLVGRYGNVTDLTLAAMGAACGVGVWGAAWRWFVDRGRP